MELACVTAITDSVLLNNYWHMICYSYPKLHTETDAGRTSEYLSTIFISFFMLHIVLLKPQKIWMKKYRPGFQIRFSLINSVDFFSLCKVGHNTARRRVNWMRWQRHRGDGKSMEQPPVGGELSRKWEYINTEFLLKEFKANKM